MDKKDILNHNHSLNLIDNLNANYNHIHNHNDTHICKLYV